MNLDSAKAFYQIIILVIITWIIATLDGAESQLRWYYLGNKNIRKLKEYMIEVLTDMMHYIGYPRTLNGLSILKKKHINNQLK